MMDTINDGPMVNRYEVRIPKVTDGNVLNCGTLILLKTEAGQLIETTQDTDVPCQL